MRAISKVSTESLPEYDTTAILAALRASGQDAPANMSAGDLVALWGWAALTGRVDELRRVSRAIFTQRTGNFIYFIGDPRRGVVKIGLSSDVSKRLATIQTGYPYPLRILCVVHGDYELEHELQFLFAPLRTNGEWFRYDGRIRAYIATVNAELFAMVLDA